MKLHIKLNFIPSHWRLSRQQIFAVTLASALVIIAVSLVVTTRTTSRALSPKNTSVSNGRTAKLTQAGQPVLSTKPSSQPDETTNPTSSLAPSAPSNQPSQGSQTAAVTPVPSAQLVMSPNPILLGDNSSPHLYMSNYAEISEPASDYSNPDLALGWYDDGQGHSAAGPYYRGWKPLIMRKTTDRDGVATFHINVADRVGNSYVTTFEVTYFANRYLQMDAGALDKRIDGDNVIYTGHVLFSPSSNLGNPVVHLTSKGFYNFDYTPCSLGYTDTTFTYTGQTGYDITCTVSQASLSQYEGGFDINISAELRWPIQTGVTLMTKFHAD